MVGTAAESLDRLTQSAFTKICVPGSLGTHMVEAGRPGTGLGGRTFILDIFSSFYLRAGTSRRKVNKDRPHLFASDQEAALGHRTREGRLPSGMQTAPPA